MPDPSRPKGGRVERNANSHERAEAKMKNGTIPLEDSGEGVDSGMAVSFFDRC